MASLSFRQAGLLLLCVAIPLITGAVASALTAGGMSSWYASLVKPWFTPPGWLFGPAWTVLYVLMGISLWLVVKDGIGSVRVRTAVTVFAAQLAANFAWSILFFGMQSVTGALVDIVILWVLIAATIVLFSKISRPAAWLLVPYICWVTFAAALNGAIWALN